MPVHSRKDDRVAGHCARECFVRWEARVAPVILIPALAQDPFTRRRRLCPGRDALHHLVIRPGPDQIHLAQRLAEPEQVSVCVDQAR